MKITKDNYNYDIKTKFSYLTGKLRTKNAKLFLANGWNPRSWSYDSCTCLLI